MSALLLALAAGAAVGLALGALGGGGGVLAVPALIYLLGFRPVDAATASLLIVAVTSATALYGHARDGRVRWAAGALFAVAGVGPAALAGALADGVPRRALTAAFAAVAVLAALRMLRGKPQADEDAGTPVRPVRAAAAGAALGGVTGFLGVGGGFLAVPALVGVVGLRMRAAVGTSLLVITVNALAALTARSGAATALDWAVVAPFTGAAVLGAWDGRRLAARVRPETLSRVFGWLLLAVAAFMAADAALR
ncbi:MULTISPECIES: sulfite exporter TauE/SafE family protein [unclassified Streptomyces]|uniref:sulfite exporter TauE/SafE family protein n=1 Tax=unclassified Streptomyces TaxID=2593676 RepID=UPI0008DDB2EB|nr:MULTISPECIES: sulfite exporter TauE/SafE family protein [unclassified Streptomyces]OII66581.1 integral membrane family protein [Streptomyces sp. CC77]